MKHSLFIPLLSAVAALTLTSACAGERTEALESSRRTRGEETVKRGTAVKVRSDQTARRGSDPRYKNVRVIRCRVRPPWAPAAPGD